MADAEAVEAEEPVGRLLLAALRSSGRSDLKLQVGEASQSSEVLLVELEVVSEVTLVTVLEASGRSTPGPGRRNPRSHPRCWS